MSTFNLTAKRMTALENAVSAMVAAHNASTSFAGTVEQLAKAGFLPAHLTSSGQGGKQPAGVAYEAAMDMTAVRLFNAAEMAIWQGEKCKERSRLSNRASKSVGHLRKALDTAVLSEAGAHRTARAGNTNSPLDVVRNVLTKANAPLIASAKAEKPTEAQAKRIAAFGGIDILKITIGAIDAALATVPKK